MSVPNRQIGWSQEEILLQFITKQLDRLIAVTSKISGGGGGAGTVTNFTSGSLSPLFTTSVATPTTTPSLSFALSNAGANTWLGNNTGGSTTPSFNSAGTLSEATSSVLTITGNSTLLGNTTIQVKVASGSQSGYLSSSDWTTFNNKQSTGLSWLLASGGTLTGINTITSNAAVQQIYNGAWTASANNQNHIELTGTVTSRNTASDVINYLVIDPTLARNAGNPATQTANAILINATFNNTFTTQNILKLQTGGSDRFTVASDGTTKITNSGGSTTFSTNGDIVMISGGRLSSVNNAASLNLLGGRDSTSCISFASSGAYATAGASNVFLNGSPSYTYSGGTNSIIYFSINPTINITGGTTTIRTLDYNPTETSLTGSTHYFITNRSTTALSGFAIANPANAYIVIGAGTTTIAPFKLTSGTNLTTAVAGCMEYDGTSLFFTRTGTTRESILTGAVNVVSPTSPNRTIQVVVAGTTYYLAAKTTND